MVVTLRFEVNGQVTSLSLADGTSLTLPIAPPWVTMACTIDGLNVRGDRSTKNPPVAKLQKGQEVMVSTNPVVEGGITWRQVFLPIELNGKWVAEKVGTNVYLVSGAVPVASAAAASVASATSSAPPKQTTGVASGTATAPNTSYLNDSLPAPLTGRFQLVTAQRKAGPYTALAIDGDATPRLGVNVREFVYFGTPQWQWTHLDAMQTYADRVRDMNMKWLRFFVPHRDAPLDVILDKTRHALDTLAKRDLLAVVTLGDSLSLINLYPAGDEAWHTGPKGHLVKDYFNGRHYEKNYLPMALAIVDAFKDHPGVGMWQLINEVAIYNPPATDADLANFITFVDTTSKAIYERDTVHPISIGTINTAHIMPPGRDLAQFSRDFWKGREYIHVATSHIYQWDNNPDPNAKWEHEDNCALDMVIANETGRAFMWTEFGAGPAGDRTAASWRFLNQYLVNGTSSGALQWGYMLNTHGIEDTGVGDARYGMSQAAFNREFDKLASLYTSFPDRL